MEEDKLSFGLPMYRYKVARWLIHPASMISDVTSAYETIPDQS